MTIDTLEVAKELKAAGFTDAQAEALTRVVSRAQDVDLSQLATKSDLTRMETELRSQLASKSDLTRMETELRLAWKADMAETKAEMIKWVFGVAVAQVA